MEHPPTTFTLLPPDPPPFPSSPSSPSTVDLSPLEFVLALLALITIPALIYTFLFSIKCPLFRRRHPPPPSSDHHHHTPPPQTKDDNASDVTYKKEAHVKEIGTECPVCLSGFVDGEEVKQLSVCKHSFHASCIDTWLSSHDNCPVCRALVYVKRSSDSGNRNELSSRNRGRDRDDHLQGLPDASSLV